MSQYSGFMRVRNNMSSAVKGWVQHISSEFPYYTDDPTDYYSSDKLTFNLAAPPEGFFKDGPVSESQAISSEDSKFDIWVWNFTIEDFLGGGSAGSASCGFESEDDGGTVELILDGGNGQIFIKTPVSNGCTESLV